MAETLAPHPVFSTQRLRLRRFREEDTQAMHACFANPDAMAFWNRSPHTTLIETERVVQKCIDSRPDDYRVWAVADRATDVCLGMVNYHDRHIANKRAGIGYIIHPSHHGQGIATEAVSALLDFCFGDLGLHRVQALIDPGNAASRRLVEKLGFRSEGILRESLCVDDVWRNEMVYALLASEWQG